LLLLECGLLDEKSKKYKMSGGVVDQHDMFAPCIILTFSRIPYSQEKERNISSKEFYLIVGKDTD
jgi:hypothetical protein